MDDEADEADAALTLTLRPGAGYDRGDPSAATVTVRDDELPVVTVAAVAEQVAEGSAAAFTLTRSGDPSATLEVPVAVTDASSALANAAPSTVTFRAGDAEAVLRLATADDATVEADTAVTLTLREGAGHVLGEPSSATVTVRDNDTRPGRVDRQCGVGAGDRGRNARVSGDAERAVRRGDPGLLPPRRRQHGDGGGTTTGTSATSAAP